MILTCPACATQYAVKDGAIPPGGRQVRCASCKHSWHQDPEDRTSAETMPETAVAPPQPRPGDVEQPIADIPERESADGMIAQELPQNGDPALDHQSPDVQPDPPRDEERAAGLDDYAPPASALETPVEEEPAYQAHLQHDGDDFDSIPALHDEDEGRTGRRIGWIVGIILLVVAAAAAFWFLAPAEYKARAGIAAAGETPLELMLTTSDRQKLASGNELLAISGRIINPTDREQAVPPIKAELRNKATQKVVYSWTIAPPARVLPARGSASFNSAEVDIPQGGDELTVTLGEQAG